MSTEEEVDVKIVAVPDEGVALVTGLSSQGITFVHLTASTIGSPRGETTRLQACDVNAFLVAIRKAGLTHSFKGSDQLVR